jgi:FtsZ-interacting cell division protein ZipA
MDRFYLVSKRHSSSKKIVLIILTGVLYSKTYLALKKQNRSMVGMKNRLPSRQREYTSYKSIVTGNLGCIDIENNNERARSQNDRAQIRIERAEIQKSRAQNQNERTPNQIERAPNQNERAPNQNERAQNQNEHAQSQDERAQSQFERAQSQDDGAQSQVEHAQNRNDRAQSQGERRQSQNERAQSHNKNSHLVHNAKEQKFLTTIIIIALIAVLTALPGTIFFQVISVSDSAGSTETKRIVTVVFIGIFCLNFAVNPLVYCLRLKRYRETFKIVYGCK